MNYNNIGNWLKGYLDAINKGDAVTKEQLEYLIDRLKKMMKELENNEKEVSETNHKNSQSIEEDFDDLPF